MKLCMDLRRWDSVRDESLIIALMEALRSLSAIVCDCVVEHEFEKEVSFALLLSVCDSLCCSLRGDGSILSACVLALHTLLMIYDF